MSLTITNQAPPLNFQGLTGNPNPPDPAEIKSKAMEELANRQEQINARIESTVASRTEKLGNIAQYAEDNGYEHLARFAGSAMDAVSNSAQRIGEHVERRFDVAERLIEQRPDGGYEVTEQQADELIGRLEATAEARIAALNEKSTAASERLAELERIANENGFDGSRITAHADRVADFFSQSSERSEERADRTIERIQSRLEEAYGNPPEPDPGEAPEDGLVMV